MKKKFFIFFILLLNIVSVIKSSEKNYNECNSCPSGYTRQQRFNLQKKLAALRAVQQPSDIVCSEIWHPQVKFELQSLSIKPSELQVLSTMRYEQAIEYAGEKLENGCITKQAFARFVANARARYISPFIKEIYEKKLPSGRPRIAIQQKNLTKEQYYSLMEELTLCRLLDVQRHMPLATLSQPATSYSSSVLSPTPKETSEGEYLAAQLPYNAMEE